MRKNKKVKIKKVIKKKNVRVLGELQLHRIPIH